MRIRVIAVFAALSLLLTAGIASANGDGDGDGGKPEGDTLFNFGYDPQAELFLYNTHDTGTSLYDCTLANGTLTATYGLAVGGVVPVETLIDKASGKDVSFNPSEAELEDGLVAPGEAVGYADSDCAISGFAMSGNGHINHGQFMKLFNELIDMQGRGCLNRWLAKSGLGKKDQVAADPASEVGGVDFETAIATCDRGKKDKADDHPGRGHAKAEKQNGDKGRPDSPGNSDKAPGQQKKP